MELANRELTAFVPSDPSHRPGPLPAASHLLHVDSFDAFLQSATAAIPAIEPKHCTLRCEGNVRLGLVLCVKNFDVGYPGVAPFEQSCSSKVLPRECRERGLTYSAPMRATFSINVGDEQPTTVTRGIGKLPIMIGSNRFVEFASILTAKLGVTLKG